MRVFPKRVLSRFAQRLADEATISNLELDDR